MTPEQTAQVVRILASAGYPVGLPADSLGLWSDKLRDVDEADATVAALDWVEHKDRFPTLSQFLEACRIESNRRDPHDPVPRTEKPPPSWKAHIAEARRILDATHEVKRS